MSQRIDFHSNAGLVQEGTRPRAGAAANLTLDQFRALGNTNGISLRIRYDADKVPVGIERRGPVGRLVHYIGAKIFASWRAEDTAVLQQLGKAIRSDQTFRSLGHQTMDDILKDYSGKTISSRMVSQIIGQASDAVAGSLADMAQRPVLDHLKFIPELYNPNTALYQAIEGDVKMRDVVSAMLHDRQAEYLRGNASPQASEMLRIKEQLIDEVVDAARMVRNHGNRSFELEQKTADMDYAASAALDKALRPYGAKLSAELTPWENVAEQGISQSQFKSLPEPYALMEKMIQEKTGLALNGNLHGDPVDRRDKIAPAAPQALEGGRYTELTEYKDANNVLERIIKAVISPNADGKFPGTLPAALQSFENEGILERCLQPRLSGKPPLEQEKIRYNALTDLARALRHVVESGRPGIAPHIDVIEGRKLAFVMAHSDRIPDFASWMRDKRSDLQQIMQLYHDGRTAHGDLQLWETFGPATLPELKEFTLPGAFEVAIGTEGEFVAHADSSPLSAKPKPAAQPRDAATDNASRFADVATGTAPASSLHGEGASADSTDSDKAFALRPGDTVLERNAGDTRFTLADGHTVTTAEIEIQTEDFFADVGIGTDDSAPTLAPAALPNLSGPTGDTKDVGLQSREAMFEYGNRRIHAFVKDLKVRNREMPTLQRLLDSNWERTRAELKQKGQKANQEAKILAVTRYLDKARHILEGLSPGRRLPGGRRLELADMIQRALPNLENARGPLTPKRIQRYSEQLLMVLDSSLPQEQKEPLCVQALTLGGYTRASLQAEIDSRIGEIHARQIADHKAANERMVREWVRDGGMIQDSMYASNLTATESQRAAYNKFVADNLDAFIEQYNTFQPSDTPPGVVLTSPAQAQLQDDLNGLCRDFARTLIIDELSKADLLGEEGSAVWNNMAAQMILQGTGTGSDVIRMLANAYNADKAANARGASSRTAQLDQTWRSIADNTNNVRKHAADWVTVSERAHKALQGAGTVASAQVVLCGMIAGRLQTQSEAVLQGLKEAVSPANREGVLNEIQRNPQLRGRRPMVETMMATMHVVLNQGQ